MEDVVSFPFASSLSLQAMEPRLQQAGGLDWQNRTGADGFYLRGLTPNGAKVRLLLEDGSLVAQIYFPVGIGWIRFTEEEKTAFVAWIQDLLRTTVAATEFG